MQLNLLPAISLTSRWRRKRYDESAPARLAKGRKYSTAYNYAQSCDQWLTAGANTRCDGDSRGLFERSRLQRRGSGARRISCPWNQPRDCSQRCDPDSGRLRTDRHIGHCRRPRRRERSLRQGVPRMDRGRSVTIQTRCLHLHRRVSPGGRRTPGWKTCSDSLGLLRSFSPGVSKYRRLP